MLWMLSNGMESGCFGYTIDLKRIVGNNDNSIQLMIEKQGRTKTDKAGQKRTDVQLMIIPLKQKTLGENIPHNRNA